MSEIKQIADAYGLSYHSVKKWSKSKRDEAIRNLQAGVNPIVAELVGELQRECYVAQRHTNEYIYCEPSFTGFDVWYKGNRLICCADLNPYELQGAIVKVKELYK